VALLAPLFAPSPMRLALVLHAFPPRERTGVETYAESLARAREIGLRIDIPPRRPTRSCLPAVQPAVAPDGRTDLRTIDLVRGGRGY